MVNDKEKNEDNPSLWKRFASLIAGTFSAGAAAIATIHSEFEYDMQNIPEVGANRPKKKEVINKTVAEAMSGKAGVPVEEKRAITINAVQKAKTLNAKVENELLESLGYRSTGWGGVRKITLGTIDRFRQMSSRSKGKIFINSIITAGISGGAVYTFFNNRATRENSDIIRHNIQELHEKLDAKETQKGNSI